jgi:hypothetical protein
MPNCWYCDQEIGINGGQLIYQCECGVENDFTPYIPLTETQTKELEEMPFEKTSETGGKYIQLPKEGYEYDFSQHGILEKIEKIENAEHKKSKFNFVKKIPVSMPDGRVVKVDEDQNYFYLLTFADGSRLNLNSWSPFLAMKNAGVCEGMEFKISHPEKGKWIITKI